MLPRSGWVSLALAVLVCGCAPSMREIRKHPQQARLEALLTEVLPHTRYPDKHYWIRVAEVPKGKEGLGSYAQRHIYLAESVVKEADDDILRALIVHGVAHHRMHHFNQRGMAGFVQQAAFKAGGQFVPGLSNAHHIGGPVTEQLIGPRQEGGADRKTLEYLEEMGRPPEDFARALEFLAERNLAERVGGTASSPAGLKSRAQRIRKRAPAGETAAP
jgi:hypothetical protein